MPNISSMIVRCGTLALLLVTPAIEAATLIPAGAVWKFSDTGANLGTIWRSPDFDDSLWFAGAAQLGYGDGDEATTNQFGLDPNNKHLTTYYRHSFQVQDLGSISNLQMRLLRDDGAVVYINGAEIFRSNLPTGTIGFQTRAQADAVMDGNTWIAVDLPVSAIREGQNVLAVEVHQITPSSSDLSFDFELLANIPPFRSQPAMTQSPAALGGSGHYYEAVVVPGGASWNTASVGATNRGGYLATITSQAETGLIYDLIKNNPAIWHDRSGDAYGPWLGGIQPAGSSEPAGGWIWVTGEPFVYSRWADGEPNNRFGTEDRIHFFGRAARTGDLWNDNAAADAETFGYVVEYDRNLEPAPILEFTFNEAGAAANSSGKDTNSAVLMQGSTPQDFHSADGEGVSGLPGDRAFDNRHSTGMGDVGSGGRAAMAADATALMVSSR